MTLGIFRTLREIAAHIGVKSSRIPPDIADLGDGYLSDVVSMLIYDDARRRHYEEGRKRNAAQAKPMPPIRRR